MIRTDIHNHSLYGVDDGPKTVEESLLMLEYAYRRGTRSVCLTPHYNPGHFNASPERILRHYSILKTAAAEKLPKLRLYLGNEIMYHEGIYEALKSERCFTLNGGLYALIEFPFGEEGKTIDYCLNKLTGDGYRCVLAHVERYRNLTTDMKLMKKLTDRGVILQTNYSSLGVGSNLFMRLRLLRLIEKGMIRIIASDAHEPSFYNSRAVVNGIGDTDRITAAVRTNPLSVIKQYKKEESLSNEQY